MTPSVVIFQLLIVGGLVLTLLGTDYAVPVDTTLMT